MRVYLREADPHLGEAGKSGGRRVIVSSTASNIIAFIQASN